LRNADSYSGACIYIYMPGDLVGVWIYRIAREGLVGAGLLLSGVESVLGEGFPSLDLFQFWCRLWGMCGAW